ncbi:MAG: hypothetical protein ACW98K_16240 [Candidatus Kariarchaeaceae archaeon]|jgi:hypothetical protein
MTSKTFILLSVILLSCITACNRNSDLISNNSSEIALIQNFHCYNCTIGSLGWAALRNPENTSILCACIDGASQNELRMLGIKDLSDRLRQMEDATLIKCEGDMYYLGYPIVFGNNRDELSMLTKRVASEIFPEAQKMVHQIQPYLSDREEMLYHVIWSGLMDGFVAWETLGTQLAKELGENQVDLRTGWWILPAHSYQSGTYSHGGLIITSLSGYPPPDELREEIEPVLNLLITSAVEDQPIPEYENLSQLMKFGLIDNKGYSRLCIFQTSSDIVPIGMQLSKSFAHSVFSHFDIWSLTEVLECRPEEALVISYHELCWELLKMLSLNGDLQIPDPNVSGCNDAFRLVSFNINNMEGNP